MVLIRECDDTSQVISPTNFSEKDQLKRDCLRHSTRSNGVIDWEVYDLGLYGENLFSDSDSGDNSGSDCVFLYATSEIDPKEEVCREICPYNPSLFYPERKELSSSLLDDLEMEQFADEVLQEYSFYTDMPDIDFFWSKHNISSTGNEEDVVVLSCDVDERVCDQDMAGALDQSFLMYKAVLDDFGVKIPFTAFEMDVLKFLNVAPSQICPNSWAFIRGFEILCKALNLEASVGVFFHFYGTKDVNKGTLITIGAHPGKKLFPPSASNFKKEWQDSFARIQGAPKCSTASILVEGEPKFPLLEQNVFNNTTFEFL